MSDDLNDLHEPSENDENLETQQGNRPAEGARQGTPGEVFSDNFSGSDTAGDFLGLDVDMEAMYAAGSEEEELGLADEPLDTREPEDVWSEEEEELETGDDLDPSSVLEGDTYGGGPDHAWGADEDHLDVEELDDEEYDDEEYEDAVVEAGGGAGKKLALVAVPFVVGVLAVAGVVLVPRMLGGDGAPEPVEVARNTTPTAPTNATGDPEVTEPTTESTTEPTDQGGTAPVEPGTEPDPVQPEPPLLGEDTGTTDLGTEPPLGEVELAGPGQPFPGPDGIDPGAARPGLDELIGNLVEEASGNANGRGDDAGSRGTATDGARASLVGDEVWSASTDNQWDIIWQGDAVPMNAIASKQQVLTPRVGGVRVHMRSGEVFDGRLYAVGQNRVWIDARPGRVGLDGERVTKIDRLSEEDVSKSDGVLPAKGERVKVRVPGGHLFGHVLADDGEGTLTVQVDSGGRVTIASAEVEALGNSRVRVLD